MPRSLLLYPLDLLLPLTYLTPRPSLRGSTLVHAVAQATHLLSLLQAPSPNSLLDFLDSNNVLQSDSLGFLLRRNPHQMLLRSINCKTAAPCTLGPDSSSALWPSQEHSSLLSFFDSTHILLLILDFSLGDIPASASLREQINPSSCQPSPLRHQILKMNNTTSPSPIALH